MQELIDAGIEPAGAMLPVAKKTAAQWCLQVYWWLSLGFVVLMAVDVLRKKPKKYGLWLLLTTAFVGVMYSHAPDSVVFRFLIGLFYKTQWAKYLNGTEMISFTVPIGALICLSMRRKLLKKEDAGELSGTDSALSEGQPGPEDGAEDET